jgi:hypothetical protein
MKTSAWILLIGIICIILGAQGIINTILPLLLHGMNGMAKKELTEVSSESLRWVLRLPYISIFANIIYLMAGIFFLMKKSFSLKIMYIALTLSIFCRIVPILLISSIPDSVNSLIFTLIGPIIDISLLIVVFRLAKYYYSSGDELIKLFGEYTLTPRLLKLLTFAGFVCMSVAISIQVLWIYSAHSATNQVESVTTFHSYFPDFLHGRYAINYFNIAFCILAIVTSTINLKSSGNIWKTNMIILVFSILLLLLNLFQMM